MSAACSLRDLQCRFLAALHDGDAAPASSLIDGAGLDAEARLRVYRNSGTLLHTDALRTSYPAVAALVGDDFFADAAMRYRRERPSRSGNLQEFGADFPDFLESLPGARYLAYLGDVARLEWLRQETALAPDPTVADARAAPRVDLHPSVRLLASPHAVLTLWKYAIAGGGDRLQLPVPGEHVLLWRSGDEVGMACVDTATFAYVMALRAGSPIEIARHAAIRHDPEFAAEACLASLADEALIRFIHPAVEDTTP